jgi:hypothetical protein
VNHHVGHLDLPFAAGERERVRRRRLEVLACEVEREHGADPGAEHGEDGGEDEARRSGAVGGQTDRDAGDHADAEEAGADDHERDERARPRFAAS